MTGGLKVLAAKEAAEEQGTTRDPATHPQRYLCEQEQRTLHYPLHWKTILNRLGCIWAQMSGSFRCRPLSFPFLTRLSPLDAGETVSLME